MSFYQEKTKFLLLSYYEYMKKIIIILLVIVLGIGLYVYFSPREEVPVTSTSTSTQNRLMSIDNYVKLYIGELSPVPEVLGGRFYVTSIETGDGKGVVSYEDGHNAYTADFTYTSSEETGVNVTSFVIRN